MGVVRCLGLGLFLLPGGTTLRGEVRGEPFPVQFTSSEGASDLGLIQFSRLVIDKITARLRPEALENVALHFHQEAAQPGDVPQVFTSFPKELVFQRESMTLNVLIDTDWRAHREALVRTLCLGLTQAVCWKGNARASLAELPEPPLWLSEGLTQWCHTQVEDDLRSSVLLPTIKYRDVTPLAEPFRQVVWKASRSGRVPDLAEIQRWDQLPEWRVEKFWRQAFSYWVFEAATRSPSGRIAVYEWIRAQDLIAPEPYWKGSRQEANWWQQQVRRAETSSEYLLGWERSAQTIRELLLCSFTNPESGNVEMLRLADLPALPAHGNVKPATDDPAQSNRQPSRLEIIQKSVLDQAGQLNELESRAHPLARPAIEAYIQSTRYWLAGEMKMYRAAFEEGNERMRQGGIYHEKINDRLNWVIVNYEFANAGEDGMDYTARVRQLSQERENVRRQALAR